MEELLISKTKGLVDEIELFSDEIRSFENLSSEEIIRKIGSEMRNQNYDYVEEEEKVVIGGIKGIKEAENFYLISDFGKGIEEGIHNGVITSIYAGALIRRSLLPLKGNLNIIISLEEIENFLQKISYKSTKGIIICKPTDYQIYKINKNNDEAKLNGCYSFVHTMISTLAEEGYEIIVKEEEIPITTKIPIVKFGGEDTFDVDEIEKAVYIISKVIVRSIGFPLFGWSSDEI